MQLENASHTNPTLNRRRFMHLAGMGAAVPAALAATSLLPSSLLSREVLASSQPNFHYNLPMLEQLNSVAIHVGCKAATHTATHRDAKLFTDSLITARNFYERPEIDMTARIEKYGFAPMSHRVSKIDQPINAYLGAVKHFHNYDRRVTTQDVYRAYGSGNNVNIPEVFARTRKIGFTGLLNEPIRQLGNTLNNLGDPELRIPQSEFRAPGPEDYNFGDFCSGVELVGGMIGITQRTLSYMVATDVLVGEGFLWEGGPFTEIVGNIGFGLLLVGLVFCP